MARYGLSLAMKCTESERKGVIIFTLEGDINLFDAPTLRTTFMNKLSKGRKVIIEMQGVEYIDSSGIGAIVSVVTRAKKQDAKVKLANISDSARKVFEYTRLIGLFDLEDSVEAALESFGV